MTRHVPHVFVGGILLWVAGCSVGPEASPSGECEKLTLSPKVVISQVYGGGGNASAPFLNDFVELFNRGTISASLSGWSIQYASATGTGNFGANPVTALSGSLAPGQHFLVQLGSAGANGVALPAPDATGTANMSATGGKVALVNVASGLACNGGSTPCTAAQEAHIVDLVGFGTANAFEGAAAPAGSTTTALFRRQGGCRETNDNNADFETGAPAPRNSASGVAACGSAAPAVASTTPAAGAFAPADTIITIVFTEAVAAEGSWSSIACSTSGAVAATVAGGPQTYSLAPITALEPGESCRVTVVGALVTGADGQAMTADFAWSFSVAPGFQAIHGIQGAAHLSPFTGAPVSTRGIVTAKTGTGFYLEDPIADGDDATSEAIYVYTASAPAVQVGDEISVTGRVSEYRPGCSNCGPSASAYSNLTTTQLVSPAIEVLSCGNALPAPLVIGAGGRVPPSRVIEDDVTGTVETLGIIDPATDGIDFYESLEGMRVQVNDAVAVGPTTTFSGGSLELAVVGDEGAHAGLRTPRGGVIIAPGDFNPERIILANKLVSDLPLAVVGDSFPGAIVGVVDYDFANFKLIVTEALPSLARTGAQPETLSFAPRTAADLDIAMFNVENLDPIDPQSKFDALAKIVVVNLGSPDILSLEEVQDNDGPTNSGEVDATVTFNRLITAIAGAGGPTYDFRSVSPENNAEGGEPGGNIRVGFLFRADRGLAFVDRPGADARTANSIVVDGGVAALAFSPGRLDPTNAAFANSRKPLAGEFTFRGQTLFIIGNHFNSKGGDQPLFGRFQPPALGSEAQRLAQAQIVADFTRQILAADPGANVVVLGDLNDFEFSAPLQTLKAAGLTALIETLPEAERYSYVYEGNSQTLDQMLVSSHALSQRAGYDVVHVNAEFVVRSSDHDPGVARFSFGSVAPVLASPGDRTTVTCATADSHENRAEVGFVVNVVVDSTAPTLGGVPSGVAASAHSPSGVALTENGG